MPTQSSVEWVTDVADVKMQVDINSLMDNFIKDFLIILKFYSANIFIVAYCSVCKHCENQCPKN